MTMRELGAVALAFVIFVVEMLAMAGLEMDLGPAFAIGMTSVTFSLVVGYIADARGREALPWMLYGACAGLIALIHLVCIGRKKAVLEAREIASGAQKKCPSCAELVRAEAKKCRFCGEVFASETPSAVPS
jgi:hypothetical protein